MKRSIVGLVLAVILKCGIISADTEVKNFPTNGLTGLSSHNKSAHSIPHVHEV